MAQLTIYLDRETASEVEAAARREGASLSKWARKHLLAAAQAKSWPVGYWESLEGASCDESFTEPAELDPALDVERESF